MAAVHTISGALVTQHRKILVELFGADVVGRALATLTPDQRLALDGATSLSYVPIPTAEAMFAAMARELGRETASVHEQVSRTSVEQNLKTIWRLFLRFTSDEALVARTPVIFGKAFPQGTLIPRVLSPGRADIRVEGWPAMPDYAIRGTRVAIETVLRLAGREGVKIVADRTSDGVVYITTWIP